MSNLTDRLQQVDTLINAGKFRQAEFLLHQLLSVYPQNGRVNFLLGVIALEAGVVIQAEELLGRALRQHTHLPDIYYYLGLCLNQQNRFGDAIQAFESALEIIPKNENIKKQIRIQKHHWQQFNALRANKPVKVALLTTVWGRPDVTKFVLNYYNTARIDPDIELIKFAVGSEGEDSRELCESAGWAYMEWDNRPLSDKWQAGLHELQAVEPDFLITIGSDDIVTSKYLKKITKRCPVTGCTGIYDFWFLDLAGRRMGYWSERDRSTPFGGGYIRTLGAGRCYSKHVLNALDWKLWPQGYENKLDGLAEMKMIQTLRRKPTCYSMQNLGIWAMDIKSGHNLWRFDDYKYNTLLDEERTESLLTELELSHILDVEPSLQ